MSNSTITLNLSKENIETLKNTWIDLLCEKTPPYAFYQLKLENCVITAYTSGKVVFQGKDAEVYASSFMQDAPVKKATAPTNTMPQAGSDEVGTGDYFGPVCVCASIVKEENLSLLNQLGVKDSKMITDDQIRKIAPLLQENIPHSLLVVPPSKYNQVHATNNMNMIKAKLHNQAYINLAKKYELPDFKIIDQFTPEKTYYNYLKGVNQVIDHIHFETKAENKYYSVAVGSILARYAFLQYMDEMEKHYDMKFQKGAGKDVDSCGVAFIQKYGFERLQEVAKIHFKNTDKIKELL